MRRIATCMLELADGSAADLKVARVVTKLWVGESYGGWPEGAVSPWHPAPGIAVAWRHLRDEARHAEAFELVWRRPHATDPSLNRVVTVQIIGSGGDGRVLVIEHLDSAEPKVRESPADRPRRPDLVPRLLDRATFVDGGWTLTPRPVEIDAGRALELDAFVRGDRRLPVVLVAAGDDGRMRADPADIADALAGLAHVVVLRDSAAVTAVAVELGVSRSVQPGGVRLLWPAWRSSDRPGRHPAWPAEEVAGPDGPRARVVERLVDLVTSASTLRVEADPLVDRLARAAASAAGAQRRVELEAMQRAGLEDRAAAEELIGEYQAELTRADDRAYQLEEALERERDARLRAEEAYLTLATREPAAASGRPDVRSLEDAVRAAKRSLPHLVFLPEAERSARGWQYDRADHVWADFERLERVASDWDAGSLRLDFATEARNRGLDWARDVSATARTKHRAAYTRTYRGEPVVLGPHFRRDGRQILRVYCYLDEERRLVVVGHVGGHLPDGTT
jgi:hypothetical protein